MDQDRVRCVAWHSYRCRHGAASISCPLVGNGRDALARTSARRPAPGSLVLCVAHGVPARGLPGAAGFMLLACFPMWMILYAPV